MNTIVLHSFVKPGCGGRGSASKEGKDPLHSQTDRVEGSRQSETYKRSEELHPGPESGAGRCPFRGFSEKSEAIRNVCSLTLILTYTQWKDIRIKEKIKLLVWLNWTCSLLMCGLYCWWSSWTFVLEIKGFSPVSSPRFTGFDWTIYSFSEQRCLNFNLDALRWLIFLTKMLNLNLPLNFSSYSILLIPCFFLFCV